MQIYTNVVASAVAAAAMLATGEWGAVRGEVARYRSGTARYAATLLGIAVAWQAATLGMVRLITRASSLFANVTSTLGLPLVPILAVPLFGDRMTGIKVVAMLMAVWGFLSYVYQHYLDDRRVQDDAREKESSAPAGCKLCSREDGKPVDCAMPIRDSAVAEQGAPRV
ncbi:probable purine permease 11 [Panicum virgatum]|uniref:Purine permease 11 n=1 Tax=Panicum virgatum TaxID=38727 RepID=A0A8T0QJ97_PANVG|nr:probable purine permease 11 [Panicum virgatum]KAG2572869.1 hypothetical protein PVAP13_7KG205700 [Panicum virgatum]